MSIQHECMVYIGAMGLIKKTKLSLIAEKNKFNLDKTKREAKKERIKPIVVDIYFLSKNKHPKHKF